MVDAGREVVLSGAQLALCVILMRHNKFVN